MPLFGDTLDWFDAPHSWADRNAADLASALDLVEMAARCRPPGAGRAGSGLAGARDERASPGRVLLTALGPGFGAGIVALGGP